MAAEHLRQFYPDWNINDLIYEKWQKDKGSEHVEKKIVSKNAHISSKFADNPQKDKEKEPPEGFYFLGGEDDERD